MIKYEDVQKYGHLLKSNHFDTLGGVYRLDYMRYRNDIWVLKYKDSVLVEANNLSGM